LRDITYCFGPVTARRRTALAAIGWFQRLAHHLADDFLLGRLVAAAGYRVRLSSYPVYTIVAENFASFKPPVYFADTSSRCVRYPDNIHGGTHSPSENHETPRRRGENRAPGHPLSGRGDDRRKSGHCQGT
jgi:hypothetical protein